MKKMKLNDYCKKNSISYITGYRWFKAGTFPVKAYQTDSGTILVEDNDEDENINDIMTNQQTNDIMSIFLKKTVEFSKNNSSVEDFAAYILSNFSLKLNSNQDAPKYSKVKPKPEDIQKHFQQFLKPKGEKPKPNMFVTEPEVLDELIAQSNNMTAQELINEIQMISGNQITNSKTSEMQDLVKNLSSALDTTDNIKTSEGGVYCNVDLTPQSINYISSTNSTFGNASTLNFDGSINANITSNGMDHQPLNTMSMPTSLPTSSYVMATSVFQPTPKEIEKAHEAIGKLAGELRATVSKPRRGRKPSKKTGRNNE